MTDPRIETVREALKFEALTHGMEVGQVSTAALTAAFAALSDIEREMGVMRRALKRIAIPAERSNVTTEGLRAIARAALPNDERVEEMG